MPNISEDRRHKLKPQTPAAKLVYLVLEQHGRGLSISNISERTLLPESTVRGVLTDLKEESLVEQRRDFSDARKSVYKVKE